MSLHRVVLLSIIVILIAFPSVNTARNNGRKRKQQQQSNRQYEESLTSSHAFDAVQHTYGSSLFDMSPQELRESGAGESGHQCQPINIETCRDIGYNVTSMPNFVGQETQADAELQLQTFVPLISYGCASQLRFFLCSVYTPMCTEKVPVSIGPCRPLCESVRARCAPVLLELGFVWPEALNCSKFVPENTVDHMCMEGPPPSIHEEFGSFTPPSNVPRGPSSVKPSTPFEMDSDYKPNTVESVGNNVLDIGRVGDFDEPVRINQLPTTIVTNKVQSKIAGQVDGNDSKWARQIRSCIPYRQSELYAWLPMHPDGGRCVPKCSADIRFSSSSKRSVEYWSTVWSALAMFSCAFTLLIFFASRNVATKYPERPVIYITLCSLVYASTYIYRAAIGRDVMSCANTLEQRLLVQRAEFNPHCTLSFLMLYYFGMASATWFLILAGTWASAYALRTPVNELAKRCTLYHTFAWIVPALQTLWVLVTRAVDADELTGTCSVGNQDTESFFRFVLAPMALYLSISIALFGFALLFARIVHICNVDSHCCVGDVELSDRSSEQNSEHDSNSTTTGCSDFCRRSNRSSSDSRAAQQNLLPTSSGQSLLLAPGPYTATLSSTTSYNSGKGTEQRARALPTLYSDTKSQLGQHSPVSRFRLRSSCACPYDSTFDPSNANSGVLVRSGIFALFYIVPSLCVLASIIYEYDKRDSWLMKRSSELVESIFQHTPNTNSEVQKVRLDGSDVPGVFESADSPLLSNFGIFRLRLFMSLLIGMSSGIWIVMTHGQSSLFRWCCIFKKSPFKSISSSGTVPLTGSAHMKFLTKNVNAVSVQQYPTAKMNLAGQTESHFFTDFFPTNTLTQQHHQHFGSQPTSAIHQPQQTSLSHHNSQHAHHLQRNVACGDNFLNAHSGHHNVKAYQQIAHPGSSVSTSTSVSSGHTFAYPNPNLVLDNHWFEQASSASNRTGNETAV